MGNQPTEAVIAGSKGFALALLAPLTERVGTRPRIAADAIQAAELTGGSGLVVVEFQGDGSLDAIRRLLDRSQGLDVIAAVPDGNATAEATLRSLGVESARWNGQPDDVLTAVTRRLATQAAGAAIPPPARPGDAPASAAPPATRSAVGALFDDVDLGDDRGAAPAAAPDRAVAPRAAAPAPEPGDAPCWPAAVPGPAEAAEALAKALGDILPPAGSPLAVVAEVIAGLSPLERAALADEAQGLDPEPIRRAAVVRLRVAAALATAPQPGAPVDAGAVSALLAEIDALLTDVNGLVAAAPPELQVSLEQVRNALVKEAIDFSEAAHRGASEAEQATAEANAHAVAAGAAARRASRVRVLSVETEAERRIDRLEEKRRRTAYVVLAVTLLLAGGYHGYRLYRKHDAIASAAAAAAARSTRAGAPADATIVEPPQGGPIVIRTKGGRAFTYDELRRIEEEEGLRGNAVRQSSPSSVVVVPRGSAKGQGAVAPAPGR